MQREDLKSERMAAWRKILPQDILAHIPADPGTASEKSLDDLADDLASASARRIPEVLVRHGETLAAAGRARRIRILAWAVPRVWPKGGELTALLASAEGESGGSDGRGKVAPFFRADLEAMGIVVTSRIVRAAAHKRTIEAVNSGVKEFDNNFNSLRSGGF